MKENNMSPEEKSKDLLEKFGNIQDAQTCVDEIVEELQLYQDEEDVCFEYWNEVKEELEKL